MKKVFKSRLFIFIITAIVFTTIGVYADEILTSANKVSYTPEDDSWDVNTVEKALNELYKNYDNTEYKEILFIFSHNCNASGVLFNLEDKLITRGDNIDNNYIKLVYNSGVYNIYAKATGYYYVVDVNGNFNRTKYNENELILTTLNYCNNTMHYMVAY